MKHYLRKCEENVDGVQDLSWSSSCSWFLIFPQTKATTANSTKNLMLYWRKRLEFIFLYYWKYFDQ